MQIPQLMLEIVWDTTAFNDKSLWPEDGGQPFHLSTGDRSGFGQHADYVFGWKGDSLQRAMDGKCMGASCANLKAQTIDNAKKCAVKDIVNEPFEGCKSPCFSSARARAQTRPSPLCSDPLIYSGSAALKN